MKKPTADCRHARLEIEHKWHYREDELEDGCWACGGPLTPSPQPVLTLAGIHMDARLRQDCEKDPAKARQVLEMINAKQWVCKPCEAKNLQSRTEITESIDLMDIIKEMRGRSGRKRYIENVRQQIAEIEACVPDCPYRDRLENHRHNLADAERRLEGFDGD